VRVVEALRILEAAVVDCKTCGIDTSEVREALDVLEPYCWPEWRIAGFRDHLSPLANNGPTGNDQQQTLIRYFVGIYQCVRSMLSIEVERLNYRLRHTADLAMKAEADRLTKQFAALPQRWQFVDGSFGQIPDVPRDST
jgi:hypothetical protein